MVYLLIEFVLFSILYFFNIQIQSPKFNTYTISYYIFLLVFGILIRKPLLSICFVDLDGFNLYYILLWIVMLITLSYVRSKLWIILNYLIHTRIKTNTSTRAGLPWILFLPVNHTNSTAASRFWANKALCRRDEANKLELVVNKIDMDRPISSGTTRLSAFESYIGDLYFEALKYDKLARTNQYRKMIMSEPRFTANDSFDISTNFE